MKINNNYLDKFIKLKGKYLYPVLRGIYLCFDKEGYYTGIEMYYNPKYNIDKSCEKILYNLIRLGYIE